MSDTDYLLQHVSNMRVAQSKIHSGDTGWYIQTANGYVVRGPWPARVLAEVALEGLRERVREEFAEEMA